MKKESFKKLEKEKQKEKIEEVIHESPGSEERKKIIMNVIRPNFGWLKKDADQVSDFSSSNADEGSKKEDRGSSSHRKQSFKESPTSHQMFQMLQKAFEQNMILIKQTQQTQELLKKSLEENQISNQRFNLCLNKNQSVVEEVIKKNEVLTKKITSNVLKNQIQHLPGSQGSQGHYQFNSHRVDEGYDEARFKLFHFEIPEISENEVNREAIIGEWLGSVCSKIFSFGFSAYVKREMNETEVKIFCSEAILLQIVKIINKNKLNSKDVQFINTKALKKILNYNILKYPQSSQTEKNQEMSDLIVERNDMEDPSNDFFERSEVKFELKPEGENYNEEIMNFLNEIIKLMNQREYVKLSSKLVQKVGLDEDLEKEKIPLVKRFELDMQGLFSIIESEKKMNKIKNFNPKNPNNQKNNMLESTFGGETKIPITENYNEEVKLYTTKAIGSKISSNTSTFEKAQIENGNIILKNIALFRVVTKWVEELESYFEEKTILKKEHPFKMMKGEGYLVKQDLQLLNCILQQLKFSPNGPNSFRKTIAKNNYHCQKYFAHEQISENLKIYTEEEVLVGKFASIIHMNSEVYVVRYLNCLIHNLLIAAEKFRRHIVMTEEEFNVKITGPNKIQKIDEFYKKFKETRGKKNDFNVQYTTPNLISFKLGDLLRCKISSKQKQIKGIYKQIEKISYFNSEFLKIIRVKNRLEQGNRDILINLIYREKIIIEMQLGVKTKNEKMIEFSNSFNHYIYELSRSKFGPITEMCSIWTNKDLRSKTYIDDFHERNQRRVSEILQISNKCDHKEERVALILPFKCSFCQYFYRNNTYQCFGCKICKTQICFHCSLSRAEKEQIFKEFVSKKVKVLDMTDEFIKIEKTQKRDLFQEQEILPSVFLIINTKSSKKKMRKVSKIFYEGQIYLLERVDKKRIIEVERIKNFQNLKNLLINNIFAVEEEEEGFQTEDQSLISLSQAKTKYFLPKYLREALTKQKRSIAIIGEGLTDQVFEDEAFNGQKFRTLIKLNLSENQISSAQKVIEICSDALEMLNLSMNPLKEEISEDIFKFKKLHTLMLAKVNRITTIIPQIHKLQSLIKLDITGTTNLLVLPDSFCDLVDLEYLKISECVNLTCLPDDFGNLKNLVHFDADNCQGLTALPNSFSQLRSLHHLDLYYCRGLEKLPEKFGKLKELNYIDLSVCSIEQLPDSFGDLISLKYLDLSSCTYLKKLPENLSNLKKIETIILYNCTSLTCLPENLQNLASLEHLTISYCEAITALPQNLTMKSLKSLNISFCPLITKLPQRINCHYFELICCPKISSLPSFEFMTDLEELDITDSKISQFPEGFTKMHNLKSLRITGCSKIERLPKQMGKLVSLESIEIGCKNLKELPDDFGSLQQLKSLSLTSCKLLKQLPHYINFSSLEALKLNDMPISHASPCWEYFTNLIELEMIRLKIEDLPQSIFRMKKLRTLRIKNNSALTRLNPRILELDYLNELEIVGNPIKEIKSAINTDPSSQSQSQADYLSNFEEKLQSLKQKIKNFKICHNKVIQPPASQNCSSCNKELAYPMYWCKWSPTKNDYKCCQCIEEKVPAGQGYFKYQNNSIFVKKEGSHYMQGSLGDNIQPEFVNESFAVTHEFQCNLGQCKREKWEVGECRYVCVGCLSEDEECYDLCEKCVKKDNHDPEHAFIRILFSSDDYDKY